MVKAKTDKIKKPKMGKSPAFSKETKKVVLKAAVKRAVKKSSSPKSVVKKSPAKQEAPKKKPRVTKKGKDTGSVEVQIDNFTTKIKSLIKHLKKHGQDNDSRRGLLIMVGKRRRLLNYIKKSDPKRYINITKKLKLKE